MKLFSPIANQRGVTLMVVLIMMVILGLSAGIAGQTWRSVMQREREEQLLWVGDQYRRAIESYAAVPQTGGRVGGTPITINLGQQPGTVQKGPSLARYPNSLEELLKDPRSLQAKRHIRRLYKDPLTGEDFELVKDQGGRIKGVRSSSKEEPFKKDGFDEIYKDFRNASNYQEWEFIYDPTKSRKTAGTSAGSGSAPAAPATPVVPLPPGSPQPQ